MGNLFGIRRRAPEVTAQDRAILRLKQQRDKIKIYQKKTETDLAKNADLALKLFQSGMKERALIVLRRKKLMEEIVDRTDKQLATLESLVADIEYAQIEVSVVEGLKVGTEALKQLTSLMNIDNIQQMMEDNAEAAEKQREISAILSQTSERYDEGDLLKELEAYQEEATTAELDKLPEVPETIQELVQTEESNQADAEPEVVELNQQEAQASQEDELVESKNRRRKEKSSEESADRDRVLVMEQ